MEPASDRAARSTETAWLAESARLTPREVRSFARAFAGITFRPGRFAAAWVRGETSAMNPLGYFALSAAIVAVCTEVGVRSAVGRGQTGSPSICSTRSPTSTASRSGSSVT